MMLTEHFSWAETNVITQHRNINNDLPPEVIETVKRVAVKLEKVRALLDCPLIVNSWYRSPELNSAVGGVKNSDHLTGLAVDFVAPAYGTPTQVAMTLKDLGCFLDLSNSF
jgi:zinc D-Ala-D-Ala carboxypeptidase